MPECDGWLTARRLRYGADAEAMRQQDQVRVMLRSRQVVELPSDMRMVINGPNEITTPAESITNKLVVPEKVQQKYEKLERELKEQAEQLRDEVIMESGCALDGESQDNNNEESMLDRIAAIRKEAKEFHDSMQEFLTSLRDKKRKMSVVGADWELQLTNIANGSAIEDDDGSYVHTDAVLAKYQRPDRVDRDRYRRFIKGVLQDWHVAAKEGHDLTLGSCLLVKWGGPKSFAVVRVLKMYGEEGVVVYSMKLKKTNKKQQLRVELLEPAGATESGSQRYRSSRWRVGPLGSSLVIEIVELLPLHNLQGLSTKQRLHDALLPVEKVIALRKEGYLQVTVGADRMIAMVQSTRGGEKLKVERMKGWSRDHRCYWCKVCSYDQSTGTIVKCTGCHRAFHQRHHKPIIKNSVNFKTFFVPNVHFT